MFASHNANRQHSDLPQQSGSYRRLKSSVFGLCFAALAMISLALWPGSFSPLPVAQAVRQPDHHPIPNRYIVVFKETAFTNGVTDSGETIAYLAERMVKDADGIRHHTYEQAPPGFAATLSPEAVQKLRENPIVADVVPDRFLEYDEVQVPVPSWGLGRIDQRSGLDNRYRYDLTGKGVHIYMIDSGVRASHIDFRGRVGKGYSAVPGFDPNEDCVGHGTHTAGTACGVSYGVAKKAILHSVRVGGCGTPALMDIIAGIDWVAGNHEKPAVANLSLGVPAEETLDKAVNRLIASGVTVVVSAGNDARDAGARSPARVPAAITVGSSSFWAVDRISPFSNFGPVVDIFAPGHNITSASNNNDTDSTVKFGTSMAAPHVAGWAAMYLEAFGKATPAAIQAALIQHSTPNALWAVPEGTPNRLLYVPNLDDRGCLTQTSIAAHPAEYTSERKNDFTRLIRLRDEVLSNSDLGQRLIKIHKDHSFEAARVLLANAYLRTQLMDLLASSRGVADSLVDGDGQVPITRDLIMKIEAYLTGLAQHASPAMRDDLLRAWREADLWAYEGKPVREVLENRSERQQSGWQSK